MAVDKSEAMKRNEGILWRVLNWIAMNGIVESHAGEEGDRQPQQWNNNNPSPDRIEIFQVVTWGEEEEETGTLHWSLVSFSVYSILFSHIMPVQHQTNQSGSIPTTNQIWYISGSSLSLISTTPRSYLIISLLLLSPAYLAYSSNQRVFCGFTR